MGDQEKTLYDFEMGICKTFIKKLFAQTSNYTYPGHINYSTPGICLPFRLSVSLRKYKYNGGAYYKYITIVISRHNINECK